MHIFFLSYLLVEWSSPERHHMRFSLLSFVLQASIKAAVTESTISLMTTTTTRTALSTCCVSDSQFLKAQIYWLNNYGIFCLYQYFWSSTFFSSDIPRSLGHTAFQTLMKHLILFIDTFAKHLSSHYYWYNHYFFSITIIVLAFGVILYLDMFFHLSPSTLILPFPFLTY